jgi:hypothetical protein
VPDRRGEAHKVRGLRHTGISRLANDRRIPPVYVRDFAGHRSLKTPGYVHKIESAEVTAAAAEAMAVEHSWNVDSGTRGVMGNDLHPEPA